jgi:tetratricopeptide (TPR) repeat protein
MSIIHDALKKAEREREPRRTGLPLSHGVRTARRRWRGGVTAAVLVGVTTVGAVSAWLWLQGLEGERTHRTTMPLPQSSPTKALEGAAQAARPVDGAEPIPVAKPLETQPRPRADEVVSSATPISSKFEARAAAETAFERAREAESKGQWEQAKQQYHQALTLNPSLVEARNNLGNLYIRQRQLTAAIGEFQAALAVDPHYAIARNNLGSVYFMLGEDTQAIQEFLTALRIDGAYVSPYYNLASLYARRGDADQAVAFLTKALALEPMVLSWLQEDPDFDRIRAAPQLQRLRPRDQARR